MAQPTLVDSGSSDYSDVITGGEATKSFTWVTGDVFHILGHTEDNGVTLNTPSTAGANLTFSLISSTNTTNTTKAYYWRGTATGSGNGTITATSNGTTNARGLTAFQYRSTSGQGTPQILDGSALKTISVTRTQANSHIIETLGDWNEVGDVTTDPTPAGGNQLIELAVSGRIDFFVTQWGDQGATGTTSYGLTNHTGTVNLSGIAVEIKGISGGQTVAIGQATETDSAFSVVKKKVKVTGLTTETDSVLTAKVVKTKLVGLNAETDSAFSVIHTKSKLLGLNTEADSVLALTKKKTRSIGQASESDITFSVTKGHTLTTGLATETDSSLAVSKLKRKLLGQPSETDSALALQFGHVIVVNQATETDSVFSLTHSKRKAIGQAQEFDLALPLQSPTPPGAAGFWSGLWSSTFWSSQWRQ